MCIWCLLGFHPRLSFLRWEVYLEVRVSISCKLFLVSTTPAGGRFARKSMVKRLENALICILDDWMIGCFVGCVWIDNFCCFVVDCVWWVHFYFMRRKHQQNTKVRRMANVNVRTSWYIQTVIPNITTWRRELKIFCLTAVFRSDQYFVRLILLEGSQPEKKQWRVITIYKGCCSMLMLYFGKIPDASLFVPMQSINRPNIDFIDVFSIKKYLLQEQPRTSMRNNDEFPRTSLSELIILVWYFIDFMTVFWHLWVELDRIKS